MSPAPTRLLHRDWFSSGNVFVWGRSIMRRCRTFCGRLFNYSHISHRSNAYSYAVLIHGANKSGHKATKAEAIKDLAEAIGAGFEDHAARLSITDCLPAFSPTTVQRDV